MDFVQRRLPVVARYCANPVVDAVEVVDVAAEPPLLFGARLHMVGPKLHAKAVVSDAGWQALHGQLALQPLHKIGALTLKANRKLAQVVKRQPEGDPVLQRCVGGSLELFAQPSRQRWGTLQVHPADGRHIERVVHEQMQFGRALGRAGLAPVRKVRGRRHAGVPRIEHGVDILALRRLMA